MKYFISFIILIACLCGCKSKQVKQKLSIDSSGVWKIETDNGKQLDSIHYTVKNGTLIIVPPLRYYLIGYYASNKEVYTYGNCVAEVNGDDVPTDTALLSYVYNGWYCLNPTIPKYRYTDPVRVCSSCNPKISNGQGYL